MRTLQIAWSFATILQHHRHTTAVSLRGLGIHLWYWSIMWFMFSDEIWIQNRCFIASSDVSHDHSISSFFSPSCCSDEAVIVQSQHYLPSSHCHLTSPIFHHNHLTLTVVCLSSKAIVSSSHCNTTLTLPCNDLLNLPWWFWLQWYCQLYGKLQACCNEKYSAVWLRRFSNFENPHSNQSRTLNMAVKVGMMTEVLPQPTNLLIFALCSS